MLSSSRKLKALRINWRNAISAPEPCHEWVHSLTAARKRPFLEHQTKHDTSSNREITLAVRYSLIAFDLVHGYALPAQPQLQHQPDSALAGWFRQRTQDGRSTTKKTMIVALARKLLIALWQLATTGVVPAGVHLHV